MYIAPGQGLTTPWERNFDDNRNILSLRSFVVSFKKKISLKSDFIRFFFFKILYMYIAPGQEQTVPRRQILMSSEMSCQFILLLQGDKILMSTGRPYHFIHLLRVQRNLFEV